MVQSNMFGKVITVEARLTDLIGTSCVIEITEKLVTAAVLYKGMPQ